MKNTFSITSPLGNLEIDAEQIFGEYDIMSIKRDLVDNKHKIIYEILGRKNFFCIEYELYYDYGTYIIYINKKFKTCTYCNSIMDSRIYYRWMEISDIARENDWYTVFEDDLPCIFIDYCGDRNYLGEYYKITKVIHPVYYMEKKGSLTKAAINK